MKDLHEYQILDALIEQDACFAIFRLPDETSPRFVMQTSGTPTLTDDLDVLNGRCGFVIAPFRISGETPVIVIRPDCRDLAEVEISTEKKRPEKEKGVKQKNIDKSDYAQLFQRFHKPLTDGTIKKLVLSRSKAIDRKEGFSPGRVFFRATEKYTHSCVFLFHTPQSGTWLGSTPETLLAGTGNKWQTMALAGTRYPHSETVSWDDKNLREQHLVTSYLLQQLSSFQITPEINGPYTSKAGNLAHLRTDFNFSLTDSSSIGTLLKALHPTPAVSGLPKEEAFQFIRNHEGYDRRYYTGFLGMLEPMAETNIYVNLRCMEIGKSSLTLFAGSGLISSSICRDEWKETEKKLETMASIVN
ncbi:MAG: isochorismate synthase [Porphyromonadaceae bacterium]|nr:isochorismate synthase [Porphyromonadaceae bacterium]